MISFHGDIELKKQLLVNLGVHKELDHFMQGDYWLDYDQKGCAIGCTLVDFGEKPNDHSAYEPLFGIPRVLAKLEDGIFEGLSVEDSKWWPLAFAESVPVGKDLSLVWPKFAVWLLSDVKKHATSDGVKAIDRVIGLYERRISGNEPSIEEWKEARTAAYAAAYADADADACQGARKIQALKLIEIFGEI